MSRELLERALALLQDIGEEELMMEIEAELAKPDDAVAKVVSDQFYVGKRNSVGNIIEKLIDIDSLPSGTRLYAHPPRQQEPLSKEDAKKLCTDFYFWWHNQPGTNTMEGFDEWWEQLANGIGGGK